MSILSKYNEGIRKVSCSNFGLHQDRSRGTSVLCLDYWGFSSSLGLGSSSEHEPWARALSTYLKQTTSSFVFSTIFSTPCSLPWYLSRVPAGSNKGSVPSPEISVQIRFIKSKLYMICPLLLGGFRTQNTGSVALGTDKVIAECQNLPKTLERGTWWRTSLYPNAHNLRGRHPENAMRWELMHHVWKPPRPYDSLGSRMKGSKLRVYILIRCFDMKSFVIKQFTFSVDPVGGRVTKQQLTRGWHGRGGGESIGDICYRNCANDDVLANN